METYRDGETTTIIATPLEISRILTDMLREDFVYRKNKIDENPVVFRHTTQTKLNGTSHLLIKLDMRV
jgi:hypothetical protein